ncbi:MAG: hypothetical protein WKF37_17275 [Bryobacteraceae bacterium]
MLRLVVATAWVCSIVAAQPTPTPTDVFDKAPPQVDQALRAQVAKFFQAHVDGKFRLADEAVAEDSKEIFFALEKERYLSFEIVRINYSEDYTRATVVTALEKIFRSPRVGTLRVKPPITSAWKLEDGKWGWYVVPQKDWNTAFGKMTPGPDNPDGALTKLFAGVTPEEVLNQVKISKTQVSLSSYEKSSDVVVIANGMPGDLTLSLEANSVPGLEVSIDRPTLKSGEQAQVTFNYNPVTKEAKPRTTVGIMMNPLGRFVRFDLIFAIPPELQKLLPK